MTLEWMGPALQGAIKRDQREAASDQLVQAAQQSMRWRHGRLNEWMTVIDALPRGLGRADLNAGAVRIQGDIDAAAIEAVARELVPWRKGPFELAGLAIDTEWRCELKWARLEPLLTPLDGRHVLDVGCGNGYFALRMALAGAASVIGIDPTVPYVTQFRLFEQLGHGLPVTVLPLALEDLSGSHLQFDVVVSAGVLYHRRSPIDHLRDLAALLAPGGMLALETLIVPGDASTALVPNGRYANMRNVWFVPSLDACCRWLERCGFVDVAVRDVTATTVNEQRATEWMPFQSLADALDPNDSSLTIEGHPAPVRAWLTARKP
ncbi:MAG: tRNA 5-methoxyuridine(34)/uridine 5-oxyacetic acid(34) synthase CmoB [Pseudomonadota bacterium]